MDTAPIGVSRGGGMENYPKLWIDVDFAVIVGMRGHGVCF